MKRVHPGAILKAEYLEPLGISPAELATLLSVPVQVVWELLSEHAEVTEDLAGRLGGVLDTTAQFWLNLQEAWREQG